MPRLIGWLWIAMALAGPLRAAPEPQDGMDVTKWREDLAVLREQMPKTHGNLFHTMTRQQFDSALDALEGSLPDLTSSQVEAGIMRVVAMVNDGHTRVRLESLGDRVFPVRLHFFADGLYVVSADPAYADIVGGRVKRIGVLSAEDAYGAVRQLVSIDGDNEGRRRFLAVDFLIRPEVLQGIGATKSAAAVDFVVEKGGKETAAKVLAGPAATLNDCVWPVEPRGWVSVGVSATNRAPLWEQHPEKSYWHVFLKDRKALYIQYNKVQDEPGAEPIAAYFPRLFAEAEARKVERVIIDVRLNGGGNNELNRPIWHAVLKSARLNTKGRLWVVIGPRTFSAAMNFVDDMELNTNASFVGEPTGETPNMWGDPVRLKLPNSGVVVQTSTLWWQMEDPRDRRPFRAPDVTAELTFVDYANNVDPVLHAIFKGGSP